MTPTDGALGAPKEEVLRLLASAVSGAAVVIASTRGERAYVDGGSIYLPADAVDAVPPLVVQAGLLAQGTFVPEVIEQLLRARSGIVERYLVLEATRAARTVGLLPPRVSTAVLRLGHVPLSVDASRSAQIAHSNVDLPRPPAWLGTIKPYVLRRRPAPSPLNADAGADSLNRLKPARGEQAPDSDEHEDGPESVLLKALSSPVGGVGLTTALLRSVLGSGGSSPAAGGGGGDSSGSGVRSRARRSLGRVLTGRPDVVLADDGSGPVPANRVAYPEWDAAEKCLRPNWCTVGVFDPPDPPDEAQSELTRISDVDLRRALARLGTAPRWQRNQVDGDVFDLESLIDSQVRRAAGSADEPRVFASRRRTGRDLGVLLLLDATGSTDGPGGARSLFDEQRSVVHRLAAALDELGDRVAVYAFSSRGRRDVRFQRVKEFDERYERAARRRLASIVPADFTRLGAAIRHGTAMLCAGAGTSHQLLVVVGDGLPYDDGYEDRYAREDTRVALREALAGGVGCVSVGVGTSLERTVVEEVWGEVTHLHLADGSELNREVREAFTRALRLAASRRRLPGGTRLGRSA